jgi:hypothetical protein
MNEGSFIRKIGFIVLNIKVQVNFSHKNSVKRKNISYGTKTTFNTVIRNFWTSLVSFARLIQHGRHGTSAPARDMEKGENGEVVGCFTGP